MKAIVFFVYIAIISTVAVALTVYDKVAAKTASWRIREVTLCILAVLGGALAMLLAMCSVRHKTQHTSIMVITSTAALLWTLVYIVSLFVLL